MFGLFESEEKKARRNAGNWLEVAQRVCQFRRDQLSAAQLQQLQSATMSLKQRLSESADAGKLKLASDVLEGVLRETGGRIYPATGLAENVEFFLVAAMVILGLRAYFVQPFKIPTNSMYPSYYGMTAEVFPPGQEPGALARAARLVTMGATRYTIVAPAEGEVMIPISSLRKFVVTSERPGRSMLVFPATLREFNLSVGGVPIRYTVPADFDPYMDVLKESFFRSEPGNLYDALNAASQRAGRLESSTLSVQYGAQRGEMRVDWVPTGRHVQKGETILSFDILTGDLLFVDRLSYNFIRPQVGSGFVFRTENIDSPQMKDAAGAQIKQYYVKRLAGVPGDQLEIRPPVLYRNGKPIEGSPAYGKNAGREGKYPGYTNYELGDGLGLLAPGEVTTVPPKNFLALGDNSPRSKDSRYWGFVPEKDAVGRPLFIYYPITSRWGPAH